ncbi:MAG: hypothetical protein NHF86_00235 [Candidatus Bostrichicola ureolyticus]|nr:MAG: hypothetical protein NHF86_00235 [Candidatus Bostrichicola ureolyticus]
MKIYEKKAPKTTVTIDRYELEKCGENIFFIINILNKRADKINNMIKTELDKNLEKFNFFEKINDLFEKKEIIEISKFFEKLPKPTSIAIQEFLDGELLYYKNQ